MKKNFKYIVLIMILLVSITITSTTPCYALGATPTGSSLVYIRGIKSGKYIDVPDGDVSSGEAVQLYSGNESTAQRWQIQTYSGDWCTIRSAINSNYYLSLSGSAGSNGTTIVIEYITSSTIPARAQFRIDDFGSGVARIVNRASFNSGTSRYLEPSGGSVTNGTSIVQWTPYNSSYDEAINQLWVFESTTRSVRVMSWNLVDSGGHCDWSGSTKYQTLFNTAIDAWNTSMGVTRFRKDTVSILEDFDIKDKSTDPTGEGAFARTGQSGYIHFYTDAMDSLTSNAERQKTIMHELGHALGLDHNNIGSGDIMRQGELAYSTSLSLNDKASYNAAVARY